MSPTQIRQPQRAKPLAPRNPSDRFGHTVNPATRDHWEPTMELRWYKSSALDELSPKLQQRWKCTQHSQSRTRPVELYFEWRDIPTFIEWETQEKVNPIGENITTET